MSDSIFVPRTVPPQIGEKWWSTSNNRCIPIYNGTVLPNCFTGSTEIITSLGVITLRKGYDLTRNHIKFDVPTQDGEWHTAKVKYYGKQAIYKVYLEGSTYLCTPNHRWIVKSGRKLRVVTTLDLENTMKVPYRMCNTEEYARVLGVQRTSIFEGVYCVSEPETRSFTLSGGEITGNCVGYAHGRFSEILGYFHPDLPICDAGMWLDEIKKKSSLKWGTTPKLGAVAVWKEPGKAGHVGIVEYINSDGSIMLSESGYGSSWNLRFWNSGPRYSPNWYGNPYVFQGFIYNPGTENVKYVAPYTGGVRYGTDLSGFKETYSQKVSEFRSSIEKQVSNTSTTSSSSKVSTSNSSTSSVSTSFQASSTSVSTGVSWTEPEYSSAIDIRASTPQQTFINAALVHSGESNNGYAWVKAKTGVGNSGWSAAMCCAASIDADTSDIIPTDIFSCRDFGYTLVEKLNGKYILGQRKGGLESPQKGDIFAIYSGTDSSQFASSSIGIVTDVQSSTISTVESGSSDKIITNTRRLADISWYVRPNWSRQSISYQVDSDASISRNEQVQTYYYLDEYNGSQGVEDATLREVTYITDQGKPSITITGARLSAINYSGSIGKIYAAGSGLQFEHIPSLKFTSTTKSISSSNTSFSDPSMQGVPQIIFDFFSSKNLSISTIIGFMANIKSQSSFLTSAGKNDLSYSGLCKWSGSRRLNMIKYCGSDWYDNLSKQLEFIWLEVSSSNANIISLSFPDTESGSQQASEFICRNYIQPKDIENEVTSCKQISKELWSQLSSFYTQTIASTNLSVITRKSGASTTKGNIQSIPIDLKTRYITSNFLDYPSVSIPSMDISATKIKNEWVNRGKDSKYYIATLDNYYLVSTISEFGNSGDVISVILDDGTYFNAIIALSNNSSINSILKWMASGSSSSYLETGLKQSGWLSKTVVKFINYGSWLD